MKNKGTQNANQHEVHLLTKEAEFDAWPDLHQLYDSPNYAILTILSQSSPNLALLLLLLSNECHRQSQSVEEHVFIFGVEQIIQNLLAIFHQENVFYVFSVIAHVDDGHDGQRRQLGAIVSLTLDY